MEEQSETKMWTYIYFNFDDFGEIFLFSPEPMKPQAFGFLLLIPFTRGRIQRSKFPFFYGRDSFQCRVASSFIKSKKIKLKRGSLGCIQIELKLEFPELFQLHHQFYFPTPLTKESEKGNELL